MFKMRMIGLILLTISLMVLLVGLVSALDTFSIDYNKDSSIKYYAINDTAYFLNEDYNVNCNVTMEDYDIGFKPYKNGVEFNFNKTISKSLLTLTPVKDTIKPIVTYCNRPEAFKYFNWDTMKKEVDYKKNLQAWNYNINYTYRKVGEKLDEKNKTIPISELYKIEILPLLQGNYSLKAGDSIYIDPTFVITNITDNTYRDDVVCEGGGVLCHLNMTDDNLVFYTPFDKYTGDAVYDWSQGDVKSDNGLDWKNLTWMKDCGLYGGCFTTYDNWLTPRGLAFGNPSKLQFNGGNFTLSAWVNISTKNSGYILNGLFAKAVYGGAVHYPGFDVHDPDELRIGFGNCSTTTGNTMLDTGDNLEGDGWVYIAITFDQTNKNVTYYRNGVYHSSVGYSWQGDICDSYTLVLLDGTYRNANMQGSLDEFMIFNKTLSQSEIDNIYTATYKRVASSGDHNIPCVIVTPGYNSVNATVQYTPQPNSSLQGRISMINRSINDESNGLVLSMPFEWGTAVDISGNDNDGTITGAVWNKGGGINSTGGFEFDGVDDIITRPTGFSEINSTKNFTFSLWFKTNSITTKQNIFESIDTDNIERFDVSIENDGTLMSGTNDGISWNSSLRSRSISISANKWYHFVYVLKNGIANATLNGVTMTGTTNPFNSGTVGMSLGRRNSGSLFFNGSIDNVMIWNRTLSDSEISTLYSTQSANKTAIHYTEQQNISEIESDTLLEMPMEWGNAADMSKYTSGGDIINATWGETSGVNNTGGFTFNGVDQVITTGLSELDESEDYTISLWYKAPPSTVADILMGTKTSIGHGFSLAINGNWGGSSVNDQLTLWFGTSTNYRVDYTQSTPSPDDNNWHHLVATFDSSIRNGSLYFDGALKASANFTAASVVDSSDNVWIGRNANSYINAFFNGSIDQVKIWDKVLTQAEITQEYQEGGLNLSKYYTQFNVSTEAQYLGMDCDYTTGNSGFFSPILFKSIQLKTYNRTTTPSSPGITTCDYVSGNYECNCSSETLINLSVDIGGNDLHIFGEGTTPIDFFIQANITNTSRIITDPPCIRIIDPGNFII